MIKSSSNQTSLENLAHDHKFACSFCSLNWPPVEAMDSQAAEASVQAKIIRTPELSSVGS